MAWDNEEKNNLHKHIVNTISTLFSDIKNEIDYNKVSVDEADTFLHDAFKIIMSKHNLKVDDNVLTIITKYIAKTLKKNKSN